MLLFSRGLSNAYNYIRKAYKAYNLMIPLPLENGRAFVIFYPYEGRKSCTPGKDKVNRGREGAF